MAKSQPNASSAHAWRFFRVGGFDQVRLDSGSDLANLDKLDQKLWVALACPARGIEFDPKTLDLLDTDKDGRLRVPEVIAATKWACACLKDPNELLKESATLPLAAINDATAEGRQLLDSARQVLADLGKPDADAITEEDTADTARIFAHTVLNGDGIVPADAAADPALSAVISDIIVCAGAETDRSGKPGVNLAKLDEFFAAARAYAEWWARSESDAAILPLGEATFPAAATVKAVKTKVDDYFARCRLVAFDARAGAALNREEKEYLAMTAKDLTITSAEIASLPLARIEANKPLPLKDELNPGWADVIQRLSAEVVTPLVGPRTALSQADWEAILGKLAPFDQWQAAKPNLPVERLGPARLREIVAGNARDEIAALIAKDKELEPQSNAIADVQRLVLYHRHLYRLLTNFVNFKDFYARVRPAVFQIGTLYLDQRSCSLCLAVQDAGKHATLAGLAGTCLVYCDCVRKATGETMQIVAAFTNGDSDNLMVGRNGVFYDAKGRDWDATVAKIVDNPISVRQAFWAPYKKFVRMIEEQVAKRAAAAEAATQANLESFTAAAKLGGAQPAKPAESKKFDVGVVAALGVALGAIGTFLATVFVKLVDLELWQMGLVLIAAVLVISGPSMVIAWLKLRRRNLGPILDANGWAVNSKAKINIPFGASLTSIAKLPPGSQRNLRDPYAARKNPWPTLFVVAIVLLIGYKVLNGHGLIHQWTRGWIGTPPAAATTQPVNAPAKSAYPGYIP